MVEDRKKNQESKNRRGTVNKRPVEKEPKSKVFGMKNSVSKRNLILDTKSEKTDKLENRYNYTEEVQKDKEIKILRKKLRYM